MPEQQSVQGGCYSTLKDIGTSHGTYNWRVYEHKSGDSKQSICSICGALVTTTTRGGGSADNGQGGSGEYWNFFCSGSHNYVYVPSCGYTNGQIVSATITY